jgi:hypothetical protein
VWVCRRGEGGSQRRLISGAGPGACLLDYIDSFLLRLYFYFEIHRMRHYIRFYWFLLMPFSILMSLYLFNNKEVGHSRLGKFNRALNWTFIIGLMVFLSPSPV